MKKISELLDEIEILNITGDIDKEILSVHFDSREISEDSIFIAINGKARDGNKFIEESIKSGAKVIIHDIECKNKIPDIIYILVKDSRKALAQIAQNFYDNPSKKLKLIGVTGTNGKTTIVTMLFKLFRLLGYHCALISTIENKIDDDSFKSHHTTPDPLTLASFLSNAVKRGCTYAFMECSSQGIDQKRIYGLNFTGAIFTNLTLDHLDYHQTMDIYASAKKEFFDILPESAFAIGNIDDKNVQYIFKDTKAKKYFFGIDKKEKIDFTGKILKQSLEGTTILINDKKIESKLLGKFNAYNILSIYATAKLLEIAENKIISTINLLTPPSGRLEFIKSPTGIYGIVDYAHTPDALENVLNTLKEVSSEKSKIITVVGCTGDRDKSKRSIMGSIAYNLSDSIFFTSDDPRNEDSHSIIEDIIKDLPRDDKKYICEPDRAKAISLAYKMASSDDFILIAGKGHETCQVFSDKTIPFSDMEEFRKNFEM